MEAQRRYVTVLCCQHRGKMAESKVSKVEDDHRDVLNYCGLLTLYQWLSTVGNYSRIKVKSWEKEYLTLL